MNFSTLLFLFLSPVLNVGAFSLPFKQSSSTTFTSRSTTTTKLAAASAEASPETKEDFYRAVQLAASSSFKQMDTNELDKLATQLEDYEGCPFEDGNDQKLCDKEIQDRLDVAGVLRLKIELKLRQDYLENSNLFATDVRKDHDVDERKKFKEELLANREKAATAQAGSDLGLW